MFCDVIVQASNLFESILQPLEVRLGHCNREIESVKYILVQITDRLFLMRNCKVLEFLQLLVRNLQH